MGVKALPLVKTLGTGNCLESIVSEGQFPPTTKRPLRSSSYDLSLMGNPVKTLIFLFGGREKVKYALCLIALIS